ncbi:hypothetical protein K443DRAFT_8987 [Laccaria amethystina LaAM-08-1]|uniref:Uncharacterized protein n=1 Tax=Laccaria amethystina LaAM-08-1 TaxID=1095629 RepID=A0A0C9XRR6_9AGAR|nr:hypothetical protein K443DRAFT_8987 [Laccaria amethystina LaAM-08-1]
MGQLGSSVGVKGRAGVNRTNTHGEEARQDSGRHQGGFGESGDERDLSNLTLNGLNQGK